MELKLISDIRRFEQTGIQEGFNITFNYEVKTGQKKPENINFNGNKESGVPIDPVNPASVQSNINLNGNVSSSGKYINYTGVPEDEAITKVIFDTCKTLLNTTI